VPADGSDAPASIGAAFRQAPVLLRIVGICYLGLLVAAVATAFANSTSSALNPLLGAFGLSAAAVGALVLVDYRGSANAMLEFSKAIVASRGHGRVPTLRRQRVIALVLVVVGAAFAVVGFVTGVYR
jgi:hypothetical protein